MDKLGYGFKRLLLGKPLATRAKSGVRRRKCGQFLLSYKEPIYLFCK